MLSSPCSRPLVRLAALLLALSLCAPASATWSVLLVNRRTGEVGIGQATCVSGADLRFDLACVRAGHGVGAVQGGWDPDGKRRKRMWNNLGTMTPQWILDNRLLPLGQTHSMQYGLISVEHGVPVNYSGFTLQAETCGVTGEFGDYAYAVQGNVLAGLEVCTETALALELTPGDLITKLMAGMDTARAFGGDGRCSCSQGGPTTCGSPPPSFTKTAHTGYVIVSRRGDPEGTCEAATGCANGDYYYAFNFVGGVAQPDPVLLALADYAQWRSAMVGRPDQALSSVTSEAQELVADGLSSTRVELRLADLEGTPLSAGGAQVTVTPVFEGTAPPALAGPITDHGDGSYSFQLQATLDPGRARYELRVDDGQGEVLLWPPLSLETKPLTDLLLNRWNLAGAGEVTLFLNRGAAEAGRPYRVLGSASGTAPGTTLFGLAVPLNPDRLFGLTLGGTAPRVFTDFVGALDGDGRAEPTFRLDPTQAAALVGQTLAFTAVLGDSSAGYELTALDDFVVLP